MNQTQKTIYDFVLQNVQEGKQNEAKALLEEAFAKQDSGGLNQMYLLGFVPKLVGMIKPESVSKAKDLLMSFRKQ